ncbi:distal membrane-arm assembly complex protein 2 [Scaptodrosophila lebanonensis]|uniref:Distal membrane-arm assembly complex protein 2 n=1 Tax=Drosophila lebanonensis TaxID=7225 RepID=A0A6J2UL17_DROLE|nr:distal membrane-arm assembly complex protein 2 [Scaptodrosophila lebanonensis]
MLTCARRLPPISKNLLRRCAATLRHTHDGQEDEDVSATVKRIRAELAADKQQLKWRKPVGDRPEDWNSKLKLFSNSDQNSDFIVMMQRPLDLSPKSIKNWWEKKQERLERHMQQYIPERHKILGADLASAHFILYRGGAAKFYNDNRWHRANENGEFNLPNKFHPDYKLEALRCDNMQLYYEGLENLRCLDQLKFLSFHNVKTFGDWCLDRVSGGDYPMLEVLDLSGTTITARGLSCLYRLPALKLLILDDPKQSLELELAIAMLEEAQPSLKIIAGDTIHSES